MISTNTKQAITKILCISHRMCTLNACIIWVNIQFVGKLCPEILSESCVLNILRTMKINTLRWYWRAHAMKNITNIYIHSILFKKNSLGVIWSLKKVLSHFPVTFFPFCPNNAFTFERLQFCNILTGNVCKKQNNQIYTYLQHRGKYFQFFWQIIRCPWITCPLCYHSEIVCVTEFSLSKFPAFCTITCSKLSLIQNEALLLSALKTT